MKLGACPQGVYSDDGLRLAGLLHPNGNEVVVCTAYNSYQALVNDYNAGRLIQGSYQIAGREIQFDGNRLTVNGKNPFIRHIAGPVQLNNNQTNANTFMLSRPAKRAPCNIAMIGLALGNWWIGKAAPSNALETVNGAGVNNATVQVTVEYPAGTFTNVTFGGSTTGIIAPGATLESDLVAVNIPRGATFWFRIDWRCFDGMLWNDKGYANGTAGDAAVWGSSIAAYGGATVNSGSVGIQYQSGNQTYVMQPLCVYGVGDKAVPAVVLSGDSRYRGAMDNSSQYNYIGHMDRAVGPYFATANFGVDGDKLANVAASCPRRAYLINKYFTHMICGYGINDVVAGTALATIQGYATTFLAQFPGLEIFYSTLNPYTASSDYFASAKNQTVPNAGNETVRNGFNSWLRLGGIPLIAGTLDIAAIVEVNQNNRPTKGGSFWLTDQTNFNGSIAATTLTVSALYAGQLAVGQALSVGGCSFTGSIAGTVLTVSAVSSGALIAGQTILNANLTGALTIASLGTGTGGTGTYNLSGSATLASQTCSSVTTITALGTGQGDVGTYTVSSSQTVAAANMSAGTPGIYVSVNGTDYPNGVHETTAGDTFIAQQALVNFQFFNISG